MDQALENSLWKKTVNSLINLADDLFSEFVRREEADYRGVVRCATCRQPYNWKEITCGHYMARRHNATRWLKKNAGPQCSVCNCSATGKKTEMGMYLDKKHGAGTSEEVTYLANQNYRLDKGVLIDIIVNLKKDINGFE